MAESRETSRSGSGRSGLGQQVETRAGSEPPAFLFVRRIRRDGSAAARSRPGSHLLPPAGRSKRRAGAATRPDRGAGAARRAPEQQVGHARPCNSIPEGAREQQYHVRPGSGLSPSFRPERRRWRQEQQEAASLSTRNGLVEWSTWRADLGRGREEVGAAGGRGAGRPADWPAGWLGVQLDERTGSQRASFRPNQPGRRVPPPDGIAQRGRVSASGMPLARARALASG